MKKKVLAIICLALSVVLGLSACQAAGFDASKNICVVTRGEGSGTKGAFMEIIGLKGKADVAGAIIADSTAAVLNEVKSNPVAIAFDSLGYVTSDVKKLKVNGVEATVENIKNGTYKVARPLNVVYKGETVTSGASQAFYEFLQSTEAQAIISKEGYVSTRENPVSYTIKSGLTGSVQVSGSTSLQPLMVKLAAKFEEMQSGVSVEVAGGGSGVGYKNAENGVSDFGMISEEFHADKAASCTYYEVAKDGIAVIVNPANTRDDITMEDLKKIYGGDVTAWSQLG